MPISFALITSQKCFLLLVAFEIYFSINCLACNYLLQGLTLSLKVFTSCENKCVNINGLTFSYCANAWKQYVTKET